MLKRGMAVLMVTALLMGTICACGGQEQPQQSSTSPQSTMLSEENKPVEDSRTEIDIVSQQSAALVQPKDMPSVKDSVRYEQNIEEIVMKTRDTNVIPCVEQYAVMPDLSNIDNLWQFYLGDDILAKLAQNGFVVTSNSDNEFFEVYEFNRYDQIASFVTVDSLMHTYHLYFSYLLKNVERDYLLERITKLSQRMLDDSISEYEKLKGSEWENAAKRNLAYFTVGAKILGDDSPINDDVKDIVGFELNHINKAEGVETSKITGDFEDYTQYIPRGYYEGDEGLERYFKAMMWYGRIHFKQENEDLDRSALLITKMLAEDVYAHELWEGIYDITSFFAGASDDLSVNEYISAFRKAFGDSVTTDSLIADKTAFERFHGITSGLPLPQINSVPIRDGADNVIPGFRFMGQRFTIDAAIMQKLIYSRVKQNSAGAKRMLPDVLDVPAALGSDVALGILEQNGAADYAGYAENMSRIRESLDEDNEELWSASLYAGWLNTLRPLLDVKGEGYPTFMQSEEWAKKNLECFAGSFTELKHDTVLYTKQVIAEMGGGGWEQEPDDRGYVEPEPVVYARFANLSDRTAQGLRKYGMLSADERENLQRLSQIAEKLLEISKKELSDETLTEDEYEFIRTYGGSIEHFWVEAVKEENGGEQVSTQECPAALVVDIATDPNGQVLEVGTGNPTQIYAVVKVDGKIKIARGSTYSFYQFAWPMDDRLTDSKWHQMLGIKPDESGNYGRDQMVARPEWTDGYRYKYAWE